jgi:hypothetical protein
VGYLRHGLLIVASFGVKASVEPILRATEGPALMVRQMAANQLYKLPRDARLIAAWKRVYGETGMKDQLFDIGYAKEELISSGGLFFESSLTQWLVNDAIALTGDPADVVGVQATVFDLACRSATPAPRAVP